MWKDGDRAGIRPLAGPRPKTGGGADTTLGASSERGPQPTAPLAGNRTHVVVHLTRGDVPGHPGELPPSARARVLGPSRRSEWVTQRRERPVSEVEVFPGRGVGRPFGPGRGVEVVAGLVVAEARALEVPPAPGAGRDVEAAARPAGAVPTRV